MASLAFPIASIGSSLLSGILGSAASHKAADYLSNAAQNATGAMEQATNNAQNAVNNALNTNAPNVSNAAANAASGVNAATGQANGTLANLLSNSSQALFPYLNAGNTGANLLSQYAQSNPQFSFNAANSVNTPAMQFQIQQGSNALNNSAAASGLADSGATAAALNNYGQNVASTYYQNAFNDALNAFQTNQNTTLGNLSALTNMGLNASNQYNQAMNAFGAPQASNTLNAGIYGGNTGINAAQYNAGQNLAGQEYAGTSGMQGTQQAMNYMLGGAQAQAAGALGSANSLASMFSGIGSSIPGLMSGMGALGSGPNSASTAGDVVGGLVYA
jgi:hypothetical protein